MENRSTSWGWVAVLLLGACACGGPGQGQSGAAAGSASAEELSRRIVEGQTPADVVAATQLALAAGGVGVHDGSRILNEPRAPAATLKVDAPVAFNLAAEAHDRGTSGRYTVAKLAAMWKAFGFPFAGPGTEDVQLLSFLQTWLQDADAAASDPGSFTPLFLAAMARRQVPPVDLRDPNTRPADVRLSMLEVELITAAFDRGVRRATKPSRPARNQLEETACASLKGDMGELANLLQEQGIDHVLEFANENIRDRALEKLGLSAANIEKLSGGVAKAFAALDAAAKVGKLVQLYANVHVSLTVDGPNPVQAQPEARSPQLVPVTARAGIPDSDWAKYQANQHGQGYAELRSCLEYLGMPTPSELSELAGALEKWRVEWRLFGALWPPGSARIAHENVYDAPGTLAMRLKRDGEASAKATLNVEVRPESHWGQVFGPNETWEYVVEASVYTAEPPSPLLLAKAMSFLGMISAVVELGTGFVQTLFPPTTSIALHVSRHEAPVQLVATIALDLDLGTSAKGATGSIHMTGDWSATLSPGLRGGADIYQGSGQFHYSSVVPSGAFLSPSCTIVWTPRGGPMAGHVGVRDSRDQLGWDFDPAPAGPHEDVSGTCPGGGQVGYSTQFVFDGLATHADDPGAGGFMSIGQWTRLPDGTLERTYDGARTVPHDVFNVLREHSVFRLKPIFAKK